MTPRPTPHAIKAHRNIPFHVKLMNDICTELL